MNQPSRSRLLPITDITNTYSTQCDSPNNTKNPANAGLKGLGSFHAFTSAPLVSVNRRSFFPYEKMEALFDKCLRKLK